jgi:hypothetical protein
MSEYEKLGAFYLGKEYDLASRKRREGLLLYWVSPFWKKP